MAWLKEKRSEPMSFDQSFFGGSVDPVNYGGGSCVAAGPDPIPPTKVLGLNAYDAG